MQTINHSDANAGKRDKQVPISPALLEETIAARFGCLPNFFRLSSADSQTTTNLWGFALFAYLDNPLPSLFKERLFVYLSRFCEVRYCIARHLGFLVGLGRPAGDAECPPQTVEAVLPLLRRSLPHEMAFDGLLGICRQMKFVTSSPPPPDSEGERALFACAAHVFLQTPDAARAHAALQKVFDEATFERLNVFLAFIRTAHYWTKLHPDMVFEADVDNLMKANEVLAAAILDDPEGYAEGLNTQIAAELALLRNLRQENARITRKNAMINAARETLSKDHHFTEQSPGEWDSSLHELVAAIPAAVCACDAEGQITYHNRHATSFWGRDPHPGEFVWALLDWRMMYRPDGSPIRPDEEPVRQVLTSGLPVVNQEVTLEQTDLTRVYVLVNIAPLLDTAGSVVGAITILQDISGIKHPHHERELLVRELERSNRELSRFSYALSHDLQAPIRSMRALTQLLIRRNEGSDQDAAHIAGLIEQSAAGMEHMVDSLLAYAQAGQGELKRQAVSVEAVVEAAQVLLGALVSKTGTNIYCSALPKVDGDPVLLEQLFQNLISNAIKYQRKGHSPVIEIDGKTRPEGWQFSVKDNGQGIPQEYQGVIFEPLKRLHGSDTPGSGLGLALCKNIVARHGGRIWVDSNGDGNGATFHFTIENPAQQT